MKFLIAGLGNIGNEYAHTRHNIGFDVVNAFVLKHESNFHTGRLAYVAELKWKGKIFICICPTTFMNLSGNAVKYWMDKEKVAMENLLVIVDDVALPLNKLRLKPGGSNGGHNGLKSIEELLVQGIIHDLGLVLAMTFLKGSNPILFWANGKEKKNLW